MVSVTDWGGLVLSALWPTDLMPDPVTLILRMGPFRSMGLSVLICKVVSNLTNHTIP